MRRTEHRRKQIQRADRRYEREAFENWSSIVRRHAEKQGRAAPTPTDMGLLKRLAEIDGPFSASQVVRRGWCGIRSADDATRTLGRFVDNGWLHSALPNREGHARYAFTREHALGSTGPVTIWPEIDPVAMLVEAEFLHVSNDTGDVEEDAIAECGFEQVPDPSAEGELWNMARALAFGQGTRLHKIAGCIQGLTPIQCAYAMAMAQSRITGEPVKTHIRGVAEYLGMDYNALRAGVPTAEEKIRILNENETGASGRTEMDNPATPTPTIEM